MPIWLSARIVDIFDSMPIREKSDSLQTASFCGSISSVMVVPLNLISYPAEYIFDICRPYNIGLVICHEMTGDVFLRYGQVEVTGGDAHVDALYIIREAIAIAWFFVFIEVAACVRQHYSPGLFIGGGRSETHHFE